MPIQLYHNPRCSKSRQTLALLEERGLQPEIIRYLDTPPDHDALAALLSKLGTTARGLMRTGEAIYKELDLGRDTLSEADLIEAMVQNPKLIQRPILINGAKAAIGRPPEAVLEIL